MKVAHTLDYWRYKAAKRGIDASNIEKIESIVRLVTDEAIQRMLVRLDLHLDPNRLVKAKVEVES